MYSNKQLFCILFLSTTLLSCSNSLLFQPTPTLTQTLTPTKTVTPTLTQTSTPIITATPDLLAYYLPSLPPKPEGFEWKIAPSVGIAVLVPNNWYFKEETRTDLGLEGFYVTKENIDLEDRFSTGFTLFVYKDFADLAEADKYATDLLTYHVHLDTTKKILYAQDNAQNNITVHFLRIESEFPNETEVNRYKTIHYFTFAKDNKVYFTIFESPSAVWETTFTTIGAAILDHFVLLQK
jgi:hypothetical protein